MSDEHFDAVIIGSGFGGSVMAYRLAQAKLRVLVLERGKAYPPGSFARSPYKMSKNFWDPSEGRHGLFNTWAFRRMGAVVSSGLGGGSLIYSNVLLRKPEETFRERNLKTNEWEPWPVSYTKLERHYERVEQMLNAQRYPFNQVKVAEAISAGRYPLDEITARDAALHPAEDFDLYNNTRKTAEMMMAARQLNIEWSLPKLAVTFADNGGDPRVAEPITEAHPNMHMRTRYTCRLCGECNLGCNYGSKNTLDLTYLSAARREGAEIRTRAEVRSFAPRGEDKPGYVVYYVDHTGADEGKPRDTSSLPLHKITTDRLVLAAGVFGTTFLMLKNRESFPRLSRALGTRFSGNGDLLMLILNAKMGSGRNAPPRVFETGYGPVITSSMRVREKLTDDEYREFYIQDAGTGDFVNWIYEMTDVFGVVKRGTRFARMMLKRALRFITNSDISSEISELLGTARASSSMLPLLAMGRDTADGRMSLTCDDMLDLDWTKRRSKAFYDDVRRTGKSIAKKMEGRFQDNPIWYLSRSITVHPLGGCPMGSDESAGVVDEFGQVFNYPGFYITDGSMLPGSVGPNPALTIAAVTDRCADHIIQGIR